MGNTGLKQHIETAQKTGTFHFSDKLKKFPEDLEKIAGNLRTLDLSNNRIETIPTNIKSFTNLKQINMDSNLLRILPGEIGSLKKLETLSLCSNQLTSLPSSVSNLEHLKTVSLPGNKLKEFPTILYGLRHLDLLDLSGNKIIELPPGIEELYVVELNMNQNQLSVVSEDIASCPRLKTLRLEENCLGITALPKKLLEDSQVSLLTVEGNLFQMKAFAEAEGYDSYMKRYTETKKKMY